MSKAENWERNRAYLVNAAVQAGVDPGVMVRISGFESGYDPDARPVHGKARHNRFQQFDGVMAMSTGYGFGQFLDGTWKEMVNRYGEKYGIANASTMTKEQANEPALRTDPAIQAAMLAEFTKENLEKGAALGGADANANVYAFHNLGEGDAKKLLRALADSPDQRVDSILSRQVIAGNRSLYGDGGRTVAESYRAMADHMGAYEKYVVEALELAGYDWKGIPHAALPTSSPVRTMQASLNTLGLPDAQGRALAVDGHFGPSTRQAIESFQHRYAMPVTGKADVMTVAAVQASVQTLESLRGIDRFGQQYGGVPGIEPDWRGVPYGSHPRTPAHTPAHQAPTERVAAQPPSPPSPKAAPPHSELPADMVRTLQDDLNALGVCDGRGQPLQVDGHYGRHTAAAVAAFQREQGLPATGVADNRTLGVVRAHVVVDALQHRDAERAHAPAPTFDARAIALPDSPIDATPTAVSRDSATVHAAQHPGLAGPDALRATYGMSPAMPAAMPPPQRAADQPDYMHGLGRAPTPHARADAASPDALAMLRAQVHQMEEQMAAMMRQRDTERDPQRAGWDAPSRPGADEPAPHTGSRMNYSDPRHPQHALYTDAKARLEGQGQHLPEDRLTQVVGMLHRHGFQPGWDGFLTVREDKVFGRDYSPWGGFFDVGLKEVAPSVQDTLQQVDAHQQSVVKDLAQREQQSQSHGRGRSM